MSTVLQSVRRLRALLGILGFLAVPAGAIACGGPDGAFCIPAMRSLSAVISYGNGFLAAGAVRRDALTQPALVQLSVTGEATREVVDLPWPLAGRVSEGAFGEPRKLIPLPNGEVLVLGQAWTTGEKSPFSWAMRVGPQGRMVWSRTFADANYEVRLYSGIYDPATTRIVLVGRIAEGGEDPQCSKWSQSLIHTIDLVKGQDAVAPVLRGSRERGGENRQALFDIVPTGQPSQFMVAGFVTTLTGRPGRRCHDAASVSTLSFAGSGWRLAEAGRIGSRDRSQVASWIRPAGSAGLYLVGGSRRNRDGEAPAAEAHLVRATPFAVLRSLVTAFPADGSDKGGGDRFRTAVALPVLKKVLLAGSVSSSTQEPNRAMWQSADVDLQGQAAPTIVQAGSDVFDAASAPDGTVVVVGRWVDGSRVVGFAHAVSLNPAARRPEAKSSAPEAAAVSDITQLPTVDGLYRIPDRALSAGSGWIGRQLAAGAQISLGFSLPAERTLRFSASAEGGDVDLLVTDATGRPVAFSNFQRNAAEALFATLPRGDYVLTVLAHSKASTYQIRVRPAQDLTVDTLGLLQKLSVEQRTEIAGQLAAAGYAAAPEPDIALGAETVRSLVAHQRDGAAAPLEPADVTRSVLARLDRR